MRYKLQRFQLFDEQGLDQSTIKSLRLLIIAVAFGVIQFNIVAGIAMAGYLRSLGVGDFVFGLLYAIGPALSPVQMVASYLLERTKARKRMFITAGLIQRLIWLPFGLVPFIIPMEYAPMRIWMVTLLLLVNAGAGPFMNVSFFSLAADLVPEHIRGRYFAVRMRVSTICGIFGGIMTAWILDSFAPFYSYTFVFALASLMGTMDILCFFGVKFPPMGSSPKIEKSSAGQDTSQNPPAEQAVSAEKFSTMLKTVFSNKPYMRFILFMTFWIFSINLSGPFVLVHLREGVLLSNTLITVAVQILPNISSVLIGARWGRPLDTHGNKPVMQLANGILCFAPFLWIITTNNAISVVIIMLIGLMHGMLLPGFDLGANNIMLGHAPRVNRSMYIAVYFTITSIIGIGLANATGGWLLDNVFSISEAMEISLVGVVLTRYSYLFGLTAILRCVMVYIALPRLVDDGSTASPFDLLRDIIKNTRRSSYRMWQNVLASTRKIKKR